MTKLDYVKIDARLSIERFKEELDYKINWLNDRFPEWKTHENWVDVEQDIYDETNDYILLRFNRNATPSEEEALERIKCESIQRDKDTLKRLMEKYPEEALKISKIIGVSE